MSFIFISKKILVLLKIQDFQILANLVYLFLINFFIYQIILLLIYIIIYLNKRMPLEQLFENFELVEGLNEFFSR